MGIKLMVYKMRLSACEDWLVIGQPYFVVEKC